MVILIKLAKKTCSSILTTFNTLFSMQFLLEYCRTPSFGGHNHFPRRWLITRLLSIIFLVGWYVSCRTLVNNKSRFCHCSVINRLTRRWPITGLSVITSWGECTSDNKFFSLAVWKWAVMKAVVQFLVWQPSSFGPRRSLSLAL